MVKLSVMRAFDVFINTDTRIRLHLLTDTEYLYYVLFLTHVFKKRLATR